MIGSDWTVGMEVVFVGWPEDTVKNPLAPYELEKGRIYVISDVTFMPEGSPIVGMPNHETDGDAIWITLRGYDPHFGWSAAGFRPATKRKTDISIFQKILEDADSRVPA